jgi:MoaA/NifB/PqqE/SkfB family radical SAM enzyme
VVIPRISALVARLGLARAIASANVGSPLLPYKITFVATYRCNFRCEMCKIWQKKSSDEVTPQEVALFFERWPQFRWVHLTGGELFVRRDMEDIVAAIQEHCRSLFLLNFPTTGWFGDRTLAIVRQVLGRGVGRLMVTISIDGPEPLHDELRGLTGSWERAIETFRRLRGIRRSNFQAVVGMTLLPKNVHAVDETIAAIRSAIPDFTRAELHLNVAHESAHYFDNVGYAHDMHRDRVLQAVAAHRRASASGFHPVTFLEDRYQALIPAYFETGRSPLPCTALSSSCFVDAHWNLYACSIWGERVGNLRTEGFDLDALWRSDRRRALRAQVVNEDCSHCWTPCEAYPTILGNLVAAVSSGSPTAIHRTERLTSSVKAPD